MADESVGPRARLELISAALERDPLNEELLLEMIGLEEAPEFASGKWRRRLEALQANVVARALFDHGGRFDAPELAWMLVEHVCDHRLHPQLAAGLLGWVLAREPRNHDAFDRFVQLAIDHDYLHRGTDLIQIAEDLEDPGLAARFLVYDGLVTYLVTGRATGARRSVERAIELDPDVDYQGIRQDCLERSSRSIPFPSLASWRESQE